MASLEWWYLADLARFRREREDLAALAAEADWVSLGTPRLDDDFRLVIDCDLDIGHRHYPVQLRYPHTFPHSPPSVFPRDIEVRWTGHQFGAGGELCLEFRPDNWDSEITGRSLLESARRLLSGENPTPEGSAEVISAHRVTEGQRLRSAHRRFLLSREGLATFFALPHDSHVRGEAVAHASPDHVVYAVRKLDLVTGEWLDPELPSIMAEDGTTLSLHVTRVADDWSPFHISDKEAFERDAVPLGWLQTEGLFVVLCGLGVYAYRVFKDTVDQLWVVSPEQPTLRLDPALAVLAGKRVGLVGCGSLGSKVAVMLARAGVDHFYLTDDDILLPGNLVRHDLDWQHVGLHKVTGLSYRLRRIRASITVQKRTQQLGGQESATSASNVLAALARCDLIVDATANAVAGNILAGFVASAKTPLIWAEIFTGGIGGLIARYRPGIEPPIPMMRRAIENWFRDRNTPPLRAPHPYGGAEGASTFVADDADVTAIAAPAARLAIDLLLARQPSHFPYSAYVIGLAPSAVFQEPFETFPLEFPVDAVTVAPEPPSLAPEEERAELDHLLVMLKDRCAS